MARVHKVEHARNAIKGTDIKKGDSYYWWKFRTGGRGGSKRVSKTYPKRSQTTQSDFYAQVYDLEDQISELSAGNYSTPDDLKYEFDDIASAIRQLGEEQDEKFNNMPEGLQQGDTGQLLEERRDACESWADELESIDVEEIDAETVEADLRAENKKAKVVAPTKAEISEAVDAAQADAIQAAINEAQSASSPA